MARNDTSDEADVSKLSRRGLLALGAVLSSVGGLGAFSRTASAHGLMAFRDAFIGNDGDEQGLGSKGWLFFAKDTGNVYYHDGSNWQDLPIGGQLSDTDDDGLLEAPNHDGIDVGTVETDQINLGADTDEDGSEWRLDSDSSDTTRLYSWDGSAATEYFRVNEGGPVEVPNPPLDIGENLQLQKRGINWPNGGGLWQYSNGNTQLITGGAGDDDFNIHDLANSQKLFQVNEGGPVEVKNSVLSLAHEQSSKPDAPSSGAKLWVDSDDGDLKATFANGNTKTITSN